MEERGSKIFNFYGNSQHVDKIDTQNNYYYGNSNSNQSLISDEELRDRINHVIGDIKKSRHWYPVVKVLMLRGQAKNNDFQGIAKRIESLYPAGLDIKIDPTDLQSMHYGSFSLPIDKWIPGDGPISRESEFRTYLSIARKFDDLFK